MQHVKLVGIIYQVRVPEQLPIIAQYATSIRRVLPNSQFCISRLSPTTMFSSRLIMLGPSATPSLFRSLQYYVVSEYQSDPTAGQLDLVIIAK